MQRALIELDEETQELYWSTDPFEFIKTPEFDNAITLFSGVIQQSDYDPQKVDKGVMSYSSAEQSVELAYFKLKIISQSPLLQRVDISRFRTPASGRMVARA